MKTLLTVVTIIVVLSACGASGPQYRGESIAPDADSVLYVYRPWKLVAGGYTAHVQVDDLPVRRLQNGSFFKLHIAPGQHALKTVKHGFLDWGAKENMVSFETKRGQRLFIKYNVEGSIFPAGLAVAPVAASSSLKLHAVAEEAAERELIELKESE